MTSLAKRAKDRAEEARSDIALAASAVLENVLPWRLGGLLGACIVLGGTSQDVTALKFPLYLLSVLVVAGVLSSPKRKSLSHLFIVPAFIGAALLLLHMLYTVPLPPGLWQALPGRDPVATGAAVLGLDPSWRPLSLVPEVSLRTLPAFLPPLAVASLALVSVSREEMRNAVWVVVGVAIASVLLGAAQVFSGADMLKLYSVTNPRSPVGFFSNINHQALLLAVAIPLAFRKLVGSSRRSQSESVRVLAMTAVIVLGAGVLISGSIAGYGLGLLAVAGGVFAAFGRRVLPWVAVGLVVAVLLAVFGNVLVPEAIRDEVASRSSLDALTSRGYIAQRTLEFGSQGWAGAGPGAFEAVYKGMEDPSRITDTFVNHAHNEYLELWVEYGVFGIALGAAFLLWSLVATAGLVWRKPKGWRRSLLYMLGVVCIAAHCAVDYPLRTPAMASVLVFLVLASRQKFSR